MTQSKRYLLSIEFFGSEEYITNAGQCVSSWEEAILTLDEAESLQEKLINTYLEEDLHNFRVFLKQVDSDGFITVLQTTQF